MDHLGRNVSLAETRLGKAYAKWKYLDEQWPNIDTIKIDVAVDDLEEAYDAYLAAEAKHYPPGYKR